MASLKRVTFESLVESFLHQQSSRVSQAKPVKTTLEQTRLGDDSAVLDLDVAQGVVDDGDPDLVVPVNAHTG